MEPISSPTPRDLIGAGGIATEILCAAALVARDARFPRSSDAVAERTAELALELVVALRRYDSNRGPTAPFLLTVARSRSKNLERDANASRRRQSSDVSLSELLDVAAEPAALADPSATTESQLVARIDLARHLGRLPVSMREVALRYATGTAAESARSLGLSRSHYYSLVSSLRHDVANDAVEVAR